MEEKYSGELKTKLSIKIPFNQRGVDEVTKAENLTYDFSGNCYRHGKWVGYKMVSDAKADEGMKMTYLLTSSVNKDRHKDERYKETLKA